MGKQDETCDNAGTATSRRLRAVLRRRRIGSERHNRRFVNGGLAAAILLGSGLAAVSGQNAAAQSAEAEASEEHTVVRTDWPVDTVLADMAAEQAAAERAAAEAAAKETEAAAQEALPWTLPSDARITSRYGMRNGSLHGGTDFGDFEGEEIWAVGDGTVSHVGFEAGGYGNVIYIDHGDGIQTRYAHASQVLVDIGDKVSEGDTVILAGNTGGSNGPHLHFEVLIHGEKVDSLAWLQRQGLDVG